MSARTPTLDLSIFDDPRVAEARVGTGGVIWIKSGVRAAHAQAGPYAVHLADMTVTFGSPEERERFLAALGALFKSFHHDIESGHR